MTDAITDFVQTRELIMQEFLLSPSIHKSLKGYEENLERTHQTKYRKACRNCSDEKRIHSSQDFYDDIMGATGENFHTFNMVPPYFYNGIYHMLADEKDEIVWLLK